MRRILFTFLFMVTVVLQASITPVSSNSGVVYERSESDAFGGKPVKGGHAKGKRESTRNKHENADARRKKEQAKADQKKEDAKKKG